MKTRLLNCWEALRTSLWFLPALLVLFAVVLSSGMTALDRYFEVKPGGPFGYLYAGGPDSARAVLSTIAGSMITVAGVTFSITIVALTLASSQFGPRLLRNFMRDAYNQLVLGTFIATFIYCLFILRSVHATGTQAFVPNFSVAMAIVLALVNVGVFILFIHHVSTSIQADRTIVAVYQELENHIQRLFPQAPDPDERGADKDGSPAEFEPVKHHALQDVAGTRGGYLQAIDYEGLLEIARRQNMLMQLHFRAGDFVTADRSLVTVQCREPISADLNKKISTAFITGTLRTPEQDPEFAIHQLVEIALRALSPGINDPFTAITCIDWLGSALCLLSGRIFPSSCRQDDEGAPRLYVKVTTYEGITNAAFDQIRQYGRSSVAVTIQLLETLRTVVLASRNAEQRRALLRQADMILRESLRSLPEEKDQLDVQQRYNSLRETLDEISAAA